MFISEKNKFIFFHIPKTAGSSIHIFLKDYYQLEGIDRKDPIPPIHHMKAKHFLKYNNNQKSYYKFAFVRNPFDRLVSAFFDFTQIRPKYLSKFEKFKSFIGSDRLKYNYFELEDRDFINYEEFCTKGLILNNKKNSLKIKKNETFKEFCIKIVTSGWIKDTHFLPQSEFLCDDSNNLLIDFVGKYENLKEDLKFISRKISIDIDIDHHRKTDHLNYRKYYDKETKTIIENYFKTDLNLFNYTF